MTQTWRCSVIWIWLFGIFLISCISITHFLQHYTHSWTWQAFNFVCWSTLIYDNLQFFYLVWFKCRAFFFWDENCKSVSHASHNFRHLKINLGRWDGIGSLWWYFGTFNWLNSIFFRINWIEMSFGLTDVKST